MNEVQERDLELLGMARAEFSRSKVVGGCGILMDFLAALCSAIVIAVPEVRLPAAIPIAVLVFTAVGYLLKRHSRSVYVDAENARRVTVLMKGLGYPLSEKKFLEITKPFSLKSYEIARKKLEDSRKYFASQLPTGHHRLLEMLQESVFWTGELMEKTAYLVKSLSSMTILLIIVIGYVLLSSDVTVGRLSWGKAWISLILIYLTSGFWHLQSSYANTAHQLHVRDGELEHLRYQESSLNEVETLALLDEYDAMMMDAPPVPDFVYRWYRKELDEKWARRYQSYPKKG